MLRALIWEITFILGRIFAEVLCPQLPMNYVKRGLYEHRLTRMEYMYLQSPIWAACEDLFLLFVFKNVGCARKRFQPYYS